MEGCEGAADVDQTEYAECLMPLVHETEVAELQAFIRDRRKLYFQFNPGDEDTPVLVQRAEWNCRFYRAEMQKFLLEKSLIENKFAHRMVDGVFESRSSGFNRRLFKK